MCSKITHRILVIVAAGVLGIATLIGPSASPAQAANVTVTSINPIGGPLAGGTSVTITGTSFSAGTTATIGGNTCTTPTLTGNTRIICTAPAGTDGAKNVVVTAGNGHTGTLTGGYTYANAPTVASINPTSGPAVGGTSVTITGTNFTNPATVTIGGNTCTTPTVVSPTSITCATPANTDGAKNIVVTNPDTQTGGQAGGYTYTNAPTVTSINPIGGPLAGGTSVTITGSGIAAGAIAFIGGNICTTPTVTAPTQITCTTPAGTDGAKNIVVINPDTQTGTLTGGYTYTNANETVTFNNNGGAGTMANQVTNVPAALTANTFTRAGYTFAGWNTQAGGDGTAYANSASYPFSASATLYAQWTAIPNQTPTTTFLPSLPPVGGATVLLGGNTITFTVTANRPKGTIEVSGGSLQIIVRPKSPAGANLALTATGTAILNAGGDVASTGRDFVPGSAVNFFLLRGGTATFLGILNVFGDGTFAGSVPIPGDLTPGPYTLQVNGLTNNTRQRAVDTQVISISILARVIGPNAVRTVVYFDAFSAKLTKSAKRPLDTLVKRLPTRSNSLVLVSGFVGPGGSTVHVNALSTARNLSVARYLLSKGVSGTYILKVGGNASPNTQSARRANVLIIPNKGT